MVGLHAARHSETGIVAVFKAGVEAAGTKVPNCILDSVDLALLCHRLMFVPMTDKVPMGRVTTRLAIAGITYLCLSWLDGGCDDRYAA